MMHINCFHINQDGTLESGDSEACLEQWRAGKGCYWIDIQGSETEERIRWLSALDLRPAILRNCREIGNHTHAVPLRDQLFLEFLTFTQGADSRRRIRGAADACK